MAKRGESIVEVVVACGILSVLFVSVANMIVGSVRLNNDARIRMEAVSLAQKELNSFVVAGSYEDDPLEAEKNISTDSGSCRLSSTDTPVESDTGVFYSKSQYSGCDNLGTVDELRTFLEGKSIDKCHYISIRELTTSAPDETYSGLVGGVNKRFAVVESNVRWISGVNVEQKYTIRKLIRR